MGHRSVDANSTFLKSDHNHYYCYATVSDQVFARRALGKISELGKLEEMSGLPSSAETQRAFKEATIKVCVKLRLSQS